MKTAKKRLDVLLVEQGLAPSRERAKALILAGLVVVGEHAETKAGTPVPEDAQIRLKGDNCPFVSRGGLKLAGALDHYHIDPSGWCCLDIGASTGGFTDCLLQRGARRVYTIDVGTNQLAWSLRNDERVICREGFHVKKLTRETISEEHIDLIVVDVSFISLQGVIPYLVPFMNEGARLLAMVKPQFEVGKEHVGKGGVVREESLQLSAVQGISDFVTERGFCCEPAAKAPIKGPKGNQEYFLFCGRCAWTP